MENTVMTRHSKMRKVCNGQRYQNGILNVELPFESELG